MSSSTSKVILIGIPLSFMGVKHLYEAISAFDYKYTTLVNEDALALHYPKEKIPALRKEICQHGQYINCDLSNEDAVVQEAVSQTINDRLQGILTLNGYCLQLTGRVSQRTRTTANDIANINLESKAWVAQCIPEYSPETFVFKRPVFKTGNINNNMQKNNINMLFAKHQSVIIKPACSAGSVGNFYITSPKQLNRLPLLLEETIDGIKNTHFRNFLDNDVWLAQQVITNVLPFSVEGYVDKGSITFLGFSCRGQIIAQTDSNTVSNTAYNLLPRLTLDTILSLTEQQKTKQAVKTLVARSNYQKGYFHIEFLLKNNHPYIIDANFGRLGGSCVVPVLAAMRTVSPISIYRHNFAVNLLPEEAERFNPYKEELSIEATYEHIARLHKTGNMARQCVDVDKFFLTKGKVTTYRPLITETVAGEWAGHFHSVYELAETKQKLILQSTLYLSKQRDWQRLFLLAVDVVNKVSNQIDASYKITCFI